MTYRGQVRNGQIVLDRGATLREGTVVEVTAVEPANGRPQRGSPEAIVASRARWVGPPDEADVILDEIRREKWAEVEAERAAGGGGE
jgi:hypothetical protein